MQVLIQKIYLKNAEEIQSGDKKYIKLKDPIPFYYDEVDSRRGREIKGEVKRQREPNWLDSFMERSNNYFHKTANDLAEEHHKKYEENNVEYAAYQNYIKELPTEYFKDLTNNLEFFYKDGKKKLDNNEILEEGEAKLIQDVGSYLENLSQKC